VDLYPVADALASTVTSDVVNAGLYGKVAFLVWRGVGTTGTQTLTVQASAANDGSSPTAIPFRYRRMSSGDTMGAATAAAAAGFTTAAGGSDLYLVEVDPADTPDGKPWVHLKSVEVVDAAVLAGILILLGDPRYAGDTLPTAIA
jgi:hypothetical protein